MLLKIISFFLVGMLILGVFGKWRAPKLPKLPSLASRKCENCGAFKIGKGPCVCKKRDGA